MVGIGLAFRRVAPPAFLGLLPLVLLIVLTRSEVHAGDLGVDFRGELYPEAKLILQGTNPFPGPHADLAGGVNRIFPIPAALLLAPLTLMSPAAATATFVALLLAALLATARILGVRDWRVYGVLLLWPASFAGLQTGNLTILLALLIAVAWRYREREYLSGMAVGAAIALKVFPWPVIIWMLACRRYRAAATGAAVACGSLLLVLPFTTVGDYLRLLDQLGNTFAPKSYNLVGLVVQSGAGGVGTGKLLAEGAGALVLGFAYARRSLTLSVAAALLLSPIVWLHYFVLLVIPLGARSPRLSAAWFVPLGLFVCPGSFERIRAWEILVALLVLATTTALAEWRCGSLTRPPPFPPAGVLARRSPSPAEGSST